MYAERSDMMFFTLERINKIASQLNSYVYLDRTRVNDYLMKEGNFKEVVDVDKDESSWQKFTTGEKWGGRDLHAWFRTTVKVPQQFDGKMVALYVSTGATGWDATNPQFILFVNGQMVQGLDVNHREVILSRKAKAGDEYQIDLHAYSGMDDKKADLLVQLVALDEKIRNIYYNIKVPAIVASGMDKDNKTTIDILKVLNETINILDLRKPYSKAFYDSIDEADAFLQREFYEKMCNYDDVIATCVGHTHIDVAWLWTVAQTREKAARSFATVLNLMDEYPEYMFMSSQPQLYKFVKEDHPELYERIKQKIGEGRWEADGAMWVEADCNVTSGESLVRQILFGTRFFEEEFGVKNCVLWLPDVFGYSAAIPQILKKSDIDYFMTTKISWNQFNKLPYDTFMWEGIDGTEVLTHFVTTRDANFNWAGHFTTYNGYIHPGAVMGAWERYQQKDINNDILISFGYGDGGGGPTKDMLENARRMSKGIPNCPKVQMGTAGEYFKRLDKKVSNQKNLPKWVGELYLEYHRGTYTSMARNKRDNRKSELLYQDVEFLSSLAGHVGYEYPQKRLNDNWEIILRNQFHDILPGSSIKEVYDVTKEEYKEILNNGKDMAKKALDTISANISLDKPSVIVYNTLSFTRSDVAFVSLPDGIKHPKVMDEKGNILPSQMVEKDGEMKLAFFAKDIPSKGYKCFELTEGTENNEECMIVSKARLENDFFSIDMDEKGTFTSMYDKKNDREVLKPGERGNVLQAFEDKPMNYDNWDIDIFYQEKMWEVDDVEKIEVVENGAVMGKLRIYRKFQDSTIIQDICIYRDISRIDFETYVDWKEDQVLLKAAFPVDVLAPKATYEIQYGNVERPTHWNTSWDWARFEVCAHKWADVSEDGFGVSLMNDSKYGYDIKDSIMRLSLLKSGMEPNPTADREEHRFTYSLYPHGGDWRDAGTVKMAYELNVPLYTKVEQPHGGSMPSAMSMVQVDAENVIIEVVKKAEDTDHTIIRMYECYNRRTKATLTFFKDLKEARECNLMEKDTEDINIDGNSITFDIKPYEIKTFKVKF
jgi:alpha-mannosidase